jgi:hypothetical protein
MESGKSPPSSLASSTRKRMAATSFEEGRGPVSTDDGSRGVET